jgi:GWxTD domain-containing protein
MGVFTLRFECQTKQGPLMMERTVTIHTPEHKMSLSSPLLLANYGKTDQINAPMVKGGYHLTLLNQKNRRNQKKLAVYTEVYVHQEATDHKKFVQLSIFDENDNFLKSQIFHVNASYSSAYVFEMETSDLQSGKYQLQVELKSFPKGTVYDSYSLNFYRENPYLVSAGDSIEYYLQQEFVAQLEEAELDYCLRAVVPVVPQIFSDRWAQTARKGTADEKRALLLEYYIFLDHNNYFQEFLNYMEEVEFCNEQFDSGFGYGFESDRGVIYLKYGPPNDQFQQEHESTAPPYEIWTYNELKETRQTNVKFIFHNPSLAPGNYVLLHSTARGELYNPRWKLD